MHHELTCGFVRHHRSSRARRSNEITNEEKPLGWMHMSREVRLTMRLANLLLYSLGRYDATSRAACKCEDIYIINGYVVVLLSFSPSAMSQIEFRCSCH